MRVVRRRGAIGSGDGFTLMEVMFVTVIVGILSTSIYPTYKSAITSAKMTIYAGAHQSPKEALSAKAKLIKSTSITVTEFHPDIIVNDSEFTLSGLGLPTGTRVSK